VAERHGRRADRGNNGCRVGESILETGTSQNLSRGSDSLITINELCYFSWLGIER